MRISACAVATLPLITVACAGSGAPAPLLAAEGPSAEVADETEQTDACEGQRRYIEMEPAFKAAVRLGPEVRPFMFDNAVIASGGLIRVMRGTVDDIGRGTKFGLMDRTGRLTADFAWDFIGWLCDGQARACVGCTKDCADSECEHWSIKGGTWSCIDGTGGSVTCADKTP